MTQADPVDLAVESHSSSLAGLCITVCGGGGIAATELPRIARELRRHGALVSFVVTENALKFVGLASLEWASARPVTVSPTGLAEHVFEGDAVLVAPATADILGKAANGVCVDGATTLLQSALGLGKPIVFLPTMHESMARSPFVQRNIEALEAQAHVHFLEPRKEEGKWKAPDPRSIALEMCHRLNGLRHFDGRAPRAAVTFGGTRVSIDSVRCLTNLSSGTLGVRLAEALYRRGFPLLLLKCQTSIPLPHLQNAEVRDTAEFSSLERAIREIEARETAAIFHAAAVSDFTPESRTEGKIASSTEEFVLAFKKTPKLLALPNLRPIPFQAGCKLTSGDRAAGLDTARAFARSYGLAACLWNHAADALGVEETAHEAVLLLRTARAPHAAYEEIPLRGKAAIAEALAEAALAALRSPADA